MLNVECICGDGSYGWQCSRCYPKRTIAGMYKQEQELAKADGAGLIITSKDLEEEPINMACVHCAYVNDHMCGDCEANE